MKAALTAMWSLFYGLLFYPLMVGLFLWLYFTEKHWIFGAAIIAAVLILDPLWRIIGSRALEMFHKR